VIDDGNAALPHARDGPRRCEHLEVGWVLLEDNSVEDVASSDASKAIVHTAEHRSVPRRGEQDLLGTEPSSSK
jgi:hypothetical protein